MMSSNMRSDSNTGDNRPDGAVNGFQLGIQHGSGSPVCELTTSAAVAAGTSAATSAAPVMAVSHRSGEMEWGGLRFKSLRPL